MIRRLFLIITASLAGLTAPCPADDKSPTDSLPDVRKSDWNGFERLDFKFDGHACILVRPKEPAPGRPWVWRTEFFGHEPQGDIALLGKGFHAAWIDVQNLYGSPPAIARMEKFHTFLTTSYQLAGKPVLEGFSRGGLFALNWIIAHPDKASCLYLDAPVCDFRSWPAGMGKGKGSPGDWERCRKLYGIQSDDEAKASMLSPVDRCEAIAKAGVPILSVCGDADDVVPLAENSALLKERCGQHGLNIELITKPGIGHHPHSLKDPAPIVAFILKHTAPRQP